MLPRSYLPLLPPSYWKDPLKVESTGVREMKCALHKKQTCSSGFLCMELPVFLKSRGAAAALSVQCPPIHYSLLGWPCQVLHLLGIEASPSSLILSVPLCKAMPQSALCPGDNVLFSTCLGSPLPYTSQHKCLRSPHSLP